MKLENLTIQIETDNWNALLPEILQVFRDKDVKLCSLRTFISSYKNEQYISIEVYSNWNFMVNILEFIWGIKGIFDIELKKENQTLKRGVLMFQFDTKDYLAKPELQNLINSSQTEIIDVNHKFVIVSKSCDANEAEKFFQKVRPYNFVQYTMSNNATLFI